MIEITQKMPQKKYTTNQYFYIIVTDFLSTQVIDSAACKGGFKSTLYLHEFFNMASFVEPVVPMCWIASPKLHFSCVY